MIISIVLEQTCLFAKFAKLSLERQQELLAAVYCKQNMISEKCQYLKHKLDLIIILIKKQIK